MNTVAQPLSLRTILTRFAVTGGLATLALTSLAGCGNQPAYRSSSPSTVTYQPAYQPDTQPYQEDPAQRENRWEAEQDMLANKRAADRAADAGIAQAQSDMNDLSRENNHNVLELWCKSKVPGKLAA